MNNNFSIQNQSEYEKLMDNLERMKPMLEKAKKLKESIKPINMKINPSINDISTSILESIPNLRAASMNIRENLSPFFIQVEQLMQTLDFPAVQPKITKWQLGKRLRQMDDEEIDVVKTAVSTMVKSAPIEPEKKSKILTCIKSTGKEVFTGVMIEIIVAIIMFLFGFDGNIQNTEINNYSYNYNLNVVNHNDISSYQIYYNEDPNQEGNAESHSFKE